jgi:hypothetical protein
MIHQSILIPSPVKTLTRVSDGSTITMAPGIIMSAKADRAGTGTNIRYRDDKGVIQKEHVTGTVAAFALGTTFILVTPLDGSGAKYIRAETVSTMYPVAGGTNLLLLSDDEGFDQAASLLVTESAATIATRIDAAVVASGGGGTSTQSITATGTTQGTGAAITNPLSTATITISAGAANTGIVLDAAAVGEVRWIINGTNTTKRIWPVSGGFFLGQAVNRPITIGAYEAAEFRCSVAGTWAREENKSRQVVATSGSVQGGGQIDGDAQVVTLTPVASPDLAATMPVAVPGLEVEIANKGVDSALLFPAVGETILGNAANVAIPIAPQGTVMLRCNTAGNWDYAVVYSGNPLELTALAGGGQVGATQIASDRATVTVCATANDSLILVDEHPYTTIVNGTANNARIYAPVGQSLTGVLNGFATLVPRSIMTFCKTATGQWVGTIDTEVGQTLTASTTQTQAGGTLMQGIVIEGTTANADDAYTIGAVISIFSFIFKNMSANRAQVFPPVGGTINGGAVDAAFVVPGNSSFRFTSVEGLDFDVELVPGATQSATASTTSDQAGGTPVVSPYVNITTVGSAGDSVSAKTYSPRSFILWNRAAANSLDFFPTVGGTVNGGAANAAFAVAAGTGYRVSSNDGLAWLAERVSDTFRGSVTLVLGAATFDAGAIGADQAAKITALSGFKRLGVTLTNAGTIGTDFLLTIVAGTSIAVQAIDAAGVALITDVSTIQYEISF